MSSDQNRPAEAWVAIARVLRPHGLRGTMRLKPLTRTIGDFLDSSTREFYIRQGRQISGPFRLYGAKEVKGIVHADFEGITGRTEAEAFTNGDLVVPEEELAGLPKDEFYAFQFEGIEVRAPGSNTVLGRVIAAREGAAHDYLVLDLKQVPGREVLLPLIPEFVPVVELTEGFVEIILPEGLLD